MVALAPDLHKVEQHIVDMTNQIRREKDFQTLKVSSILTRAARAFAASLANSGKFSHTADGRDPGKRAQAAGYDFCAIAENLSMNQDSRGFEARALASQAMTGWMNSAGHRANILMASATEIGVGVARAPGADSKYISVELFGRPQSESFKFQIVNVSGADVSYAFGGRNENIEPHMSVVHTACAPDDLVFSTPGSLFSSSKEFARLRPENDKLYTLKDGTAGKVTVDVSMREIVR